MYYTVSDFYNTYKDTLKIICGKGGMVGRVSSVGILDYEFLPEVSGRYKHYNFDRDQLVMSTLLYAKDDPRLVADAVRELISAGASGLVIKDIFRIRIPETMVRYAEARNFPIFTYDSKEPFIEDIIFGVKTAIIRQESADRISRELDIITSAGTSEQDVFEHAMLINPSFETQHKAYYMYLGDDYSEGSFQDHYRMYEATALDIPQSIFTPYERGLLYVTSWDQKAGLKDEEITGLLRQASGFNSAPIGISNVHYYPGELGYSIEEALEAALMAEGSSHRDLKFSSLGLLKLVYPLSDTRVMREFSNSILNPIRDFDLENNGKLIETLSAWSEHGMSFPEAAAVLHQHENTLRYRMDKIGQITGLDFKKATDSQQLNMAYLVDLCLRIREKI